LQHFKSSLIRRRNVGILILSVIATLGYIINLYYPFTPPIFMESRFRMPLVYFLIVYKILELVIFYLLFYRNPYLKLAETQFHTHFEEKFKKNAKLFFFLVPQGSIVFGILSYKISGQILYLWLFLLIAFFTLVLVDPKKLKEENPNYVSLADG